MQVVAQAVEATGGFDDASLSAYARSTTFNTVMGAVRFGVNGEWAEPQVLQVQFQGISGHAVDQFQNGSRQIVLSPPNFISGALSFPYSEALSAEQEDGHNSKETSDVLRVSLLREGTENHVCPK